MGGNYPCPTCGKGISNPQALKSHIKFAHEGSSPNAPTQARQTPQAKQASSPSAWKGPRKVCSICGQEFAASYIPQHMAATHHGSPFLVQEYSQPATAPAAETGCGECGECEDCEESWWNSPADEA
jgi:DNA-directed RNA polymerase subunit M/transcription elongation factor TFIIS